VKILLFGSTGQLGRAFARHCSQRADIELVAVDRKGCDASADPDSVQDVLAAWFGRSRPDWVVNALAYTAVDRAESEIDLAFRINAKFPQVLANTTERFGATMIHFSSDYVFDGSLSGRAYREDDPCDPRSVYGQSKREGELAVLQASQSAWVIRTSWVVGVDGQNFAKTMLRLACERPRLRVVSDQWGVPSPAAFLAREVTEAMMTRPDENNHGLYHLCPSGETNWHDYATWVIDEAARHPLWKDRIRILGAQAIEAIGSADYPTAAQRPANSRLDCSRWCARFSPSGLPDWKVALEPSLQAILDNNHTSCA